MSVQAKVQKPRPQKKLPTFARELRWILIIGGVIGLVCAFILTHDELKLAQNPNYIPSCNLNPVISCGSVMKSAQAHLFGFSNPWIGLMAFPVLITVGATLTAGAKFKRWFWIGLNLGTFLGLVFIHWLFFETVYHIHALCPYCMAVWIVTITAFWYTTLHNLQAGNLFKSAQNSKLVNFISRHHLDILIVWFLIITGLILQHFWYYYGKYF